MNKDQLEGRIEKIKGNIKKFTGKVIDDSNLEIEGVVQKISGKFQAGFGDLKDTIEKSNSR